jgi:hypothetical protein
MLACTLRKTPCCVIYKSAQDCAHRHNIEQRLTRFLYSSNLRTVLFLHALYARKEQSPKNALAPSLTAFVVCKLLEQYFPDFVDTQFTARMEDALDQIATGAANKTDYLSQVCFHHIYYYCYFILHYSALYSSKLLYVGKYTITPFCIVSHSVCIVSRCYV